MELSKVLPLINAKGATSIIPLSINEFVLSIPKILCKESNRGLKYGSTFCCKSPGRNPKLSPASTAGLVKTIFSIFISFYSLAAQTDAKNVLPVPAGPIAKVRSKFSIDSTYSFCLIVLGLKYLPSLERARTFFPSSA